MMLRLWFLCYYFDRFHARRKGTLQYYDGDVNKNEFLNHILNQKHLGEDFRDRLKKWIHDIFDVWILQHDKIGGRMQKRRRLIYDLINDAKRKNYLIEIDNNTNNPKLRMDDRGRRFLKLLPFIEACAREYKFFASIAISFIVGVSGTLLTVFWKRIIEFFATLYFN